MSEAGTTLQLRRYTLTPETLDEFVRWWTDDLVPVREAFGFGIPYACVIRETAELIWMVSHPGDEAGFADAERRYNEWPDRLAAMSLQPSRPVGTQAHFAQQVPDRSSRTEEQESRS